MKAKDLMIGDWVRRINIKEPCNVKVKIIHEHDCIFADNMHGDQNIYLNGLEYDPIPLTEEILVKNGFMRTDFLDYGGSRIGISLLYKDRSNGEEGFRVLIENRSPKIEARTTIKPVKYVHEIQHTLRDLEIDKEIIL